VQLDFRRIRLPEPAPMARQIAIGRTAIAATIIAAPVLSGRLLGMDTATARRVSWLTRSMAVRDGALGAGGILAGRHAGAAPWLLGGAAADAVDAVVLSAALRQGRVKGLVPTAIVPLAAATAAVAALTALRLRKS
jgi:hypothetical protein